MSLDSSYSADQQPQENRPGSVIWRLAYATAPLTILLLAMTYVVAPKFYVTWVLEAGARETQIVEILTFTFASAAGLLLVIWIWRALSSAGRDYWLGIAGVGVVAAATIFFAGEEISWGQIYFRFETPEFYRSIGRQTTLHNTELPVHDVAAVFFAVFFFLVPLAWSQRHRISWRGWPKIACMVAEGPVIATLLIGLIWPETKNLYASLFDDYADRTAYREFFEQLNEQKELIVAMALLLYAILRYRHVFPPSSNDLEQPSS